VIRKFKNEYRWLSNFAPCYIILDNAEYQSVEHAYMSAKSDDKEWKHFCQTEPKASSVKKVSADMSLIDDWTSKRVEIMKQCLCQKYAQEPYKSLLIATKHKYLQEGNNWEDKFWGVCLETNEGENILGKLIMEIRERLIL
jgi:ribA/ribD-fused uncharacterized protein